MPASFLPRPLQTLSAAPHRMLFLLGTAQSLATLGWWLTVLLGREGYGSAASTALPATNIHGLLMIYGVYPLFIFGFLFTVYPRWLGGQPLARPAYASVFALLAFGLLLLYPGTYRDGLAAIALLVVLAGWILALATLWRVYARARQRGPHERLLNLALLAGTLGVLAWLGAVLTGRPLLYAIAREAGLWLFLVPVVFLVSHRMIPFFSHGALMNYIVVRPAWGPPLMLVCVAGHALLELTGLAAWRFLADLPLAIAALHLSWVWQFRKSFHARLVAMLHIAFLWLGLAMSLYTLQSLGLLVTGTDYFGRAPLHALGIGFFTGMIVAMASRVTLGHSGRALAADALTWVALLGVNLAALLRMAGEFLPVQGNLLNLLAVLVWLVFLGAWVVRYAPLYLRPRADGQPG